MNQDLGRDAGAVWQGVGCADWVCVCVFVCPYVRVSVCISACVFGALEF